MLFRSFYIWNNEYIIFTTFGYDISSRNKWRFAWNNSSYYKSPLILGAPLRNGDIVEINKNSQGFDYEISLEDQRKMKEQLRGIKP